MFLAHLKGGGLHLVAYIHHVSLFSGCGGIDLGFKWAGVKTIAAVENKEYACETLRANFPETVVLGPPLHRGDVREISGNDIRKATNFFGEIDIVSGGPPCQPFSIAAGQRWGKDDPRYRRKGNQNKELGDLLPDFVRIVLELQPKAFMLENVSGLLTWNNGSYLSESLSPLLKDYIISEPHVIEAADYGVPQFRQRMIIIGTKVVGKMPKLPTPTHHKGSLFNSYNSVQDALSNFCDSLPNHITRNHKPETILRYKKLKFGERDQLGRVDRLDPGRPSKTIISGGDRGGGRSHLHPYLPRTITPREAARLQTFPDDYVFYGSMSRQFTQIGNAVPPLLAYQIAKYIMLHILEQPALHPDTLSSVKHPIVAAFSKSLKCEISA